MPYDIKTEKDLTTLVCKGELTIVYIADFKKTIADILPASKELAIDLSEVTEIDLACLQFLCSANMTFEKNKKKLRCKEKLTDILKQTLLDSGYD